MMGDHNQGAAHSHSAAQLPASSQQDRWRSDQNGSNITSQEHCSSSSGRDLSSQARNDSSSFMADSSLMGPPIELPPRYDSHQFPPTPPALQSSYQDASSYFDQSHHLPPDNALPVEPTWSPSEQPPRHFASRFPRWGTWLEKRALERHYAQLEQQHLAQAGSTSQPADTPARKKSWGAWINDPDAINDDHPASKTKDNVADTDASALPPLHVHHFGSRFIPHLPAQPLCSILVEISASPNCLARQRPAPRQVLLAGTAQGLFAFQLRDPQASFNDPLTRSSPSSPSTTPHQWNDNIRCIPIWTGLAVYQMCVLSSDDHAAAPTSSSSQSRNSASSGVFLALTCPSSARDGFLTSSLMQLSAHAGSVLESVATTGTFTSSSSSSSHNSHGMSDLTEGVAAANFGSTAGGGPGRAVPPGGTGVVRMWHLQAIRELLIYAVDRVDAQIPINLTTPSNSASEKRGGFGAIFKKTFARQKARPGAKSGSHDRSASSSSLSGTIDPLPRPDDAAVSPSRPPRSMQSSASRTATSPREAGTLRRSTQGQLQHDSPKPGSPQTSPPTSKRQPDPAHAAAISLASSSVPILPPSHTTAATQAHNSSLSSLFADDLIQTFTGNRQVGGKGKDREANLQAASKGVLFFSVHEAAKDTKGSGTWYLAITYARSVMVYEASVPRRGSSRAWSFVKELYAPFPIKAVAFAPAEVSDELHPFTNLGPSPASSGPTKLRVASAEGPLSASKRRSYRDRDQTHGSGRESGASSPAKPSRGSAAPASWHKADLCLLLSFGRRAVLVRLRDSHVRELDLKPLSQLLAANADGAETPPTTRLSLQPHPLAGSTEYQSRLDRSRPLSTTGDGAAWSENQVPSSSGHSRTGSMEQRFREAILDKRSNKHNWIGFSCIEARIFVRQWLEPVAEQYGVGPHASPLRQDSLGLSPFGYSMVKPATALSPSHTVANKDLPRVPAHQNASFDRRTSRLHLSEQNSFYHDALQAESNSDSDDEVDPIDARERAAKYQLTDPGPLPHACNQNDLAPPTQSRLPHTKTPNRSFSLPPAELVSAKLALASRGGVTHVMQLPLAADLAQAAPLAVMQWSDTPNAVSGWARVLGVERASSKGTTPLSHLKQSSSTSVPSDMSSSFGDMRPGTFNARRRINRLVLHVGVTCLAFLASRIESRKVSFKLAVETDFELSPDSELELIPLVPESRYSRANGTAADNHPSSQITPTESGETDDDPTSVGDEWRATAQGHTFTYPSVAPHTVPAGETSAISQELEYLCAPLLTLHPIDLDPCSCGSQSLVLPFSHNSGKAIQAESASAAHALFPGLAGDAGVVAFDWRGADDFRIFTVGIAG